jgi:DNA-binding NarL/FixJ family response regulator
VFLLDDHEIVRRGIAQLLESEDDIEVIGEAGTAAQALARIPRYALTWPSSTSDSPTATG